MTQADESFEQFEEEESEAPLGATLSGRKRLFSKELRCMMFGFGDDQNPYTESVDLIEDLVIEFITEMTHKAMEIGRTGRVQVEDIVFLVRKDQRKYARVKDLLTMNEELKKARKAFDEVKYAGKILSLKPNSSTKDKVFSAGSPLHRIVLGPCSNTELSKLTDDFIQPPKRFAVEASWFSCELSVVTFCERVFWELPRYEQFSSSSNRVSESRFKNKCKLPSILEKEDGFSSDRGSKSSSGTEDHYEEELYALAHFSDPNKTNPNSDVIEESQHTVDSNTTYQPSRWNKVMRLQGAQIIENADNPDDSITRRVSTFDSSSPAENYIPLGQNNHNTERNRERMRRPNRVDKYSKTRKQRRSLPELDGGDAASDRFSVDTDDSTSSSRSRRSPSVEIIVLSKSDSDSDSDSDSESDRELIILECSDIEKEEYSDVEILTPPVKTPPPLVTLESDEEAQIQQGSQVNSPKSTNTSKDIKNKKQNQQNSSNNSVNVSTSSGGGNKPLDDNNANADVLILPETGNESQDDFLSSDSNSDDRLVIDLGLNTTVVAEKVVSDVSNVEVTVKERQTERMRKKIRKKKEKRSNALKNVEEDKLFIESNEHFNHTVLQDQMSNDIALWRVEPSDYATSTKSRLSKLRCHNCKELGHIVSRCTAPTKKILCIMCGQEGHTYTRCRDIICLKAGQKSLQNNREPTYQQGFISYQAGLWGRSQIKYSDSGFKCGEPWTSWSTIGCDHCRTINVQCYFCRSMDHFKNVCPEVWRRYHSTIEDYIEQFDPPPASYKPNSELSCPNCTRKGHMFEDCKMSIPFKNHRLGSFNSLGIYDRRAEQETDVYYSRSVTHNKRHSPPEKVNSFVDLSRNLPIPSTSRDPPDTSFDPSEVLQIVLKKGMRQPKTRTRNNRRKRARQTMQFEETKINKHLKIMRKKELAKKRLAKKNIKMKQIFARNMKKTTGPLW
uniref:Transcription initiation factor TFIID subunit 13 n=2 Tax=Timema TaxID=61471 RepID=A0A7R9IK73_9NEOP|nr:unnamed protein product [Timema tahoe]